MMFGLFEGADNTAVSARLRALERKLDLIIQHLGIVDNEPDLITEDMKQLIAAGQKIAAIKAYRNKYGAGLADAKVAVDAAAGRMGY
jgi:hypothetical protein